LICLLTFCTQLEYLDQLPRILKKLFFAHLTQKDIIDLRNKLDELAQVNVAERYIRPIVLFQAQPKVAENKETFDKLKERLVSIGIPKEEIAIKTAEINELKNVNLLNSDCKIKYIITVNALKEGWDCPFAYILATLANKTSTVDVEQILGRVLRLPYTKQNASKFLNLSYVLTCSNDFHTTIEKVIKGLNDAGFSKLDCRVAEEKPITPPAQTSVQEQLPIDDNQDTELFNAEELKNILTERHEEPTGLTVGTMLSSAEAKSDSYDEALKETLSAPLSDLPLGVREKVTTYPIYEQFKDEALSLRIPQFYMCPPQSLFSLVDEDYKELLTKEALTDGFVLKDKSVEIDFNSATEAVIEVDVAKNDRPKYRQLTNAESDYFKDMMQSLPPESRIRNCKHLIKNILEKIDYIAGSDLSAYLDRVIENMTGDELAAMEKNIYGFAKKIKDKIEKMLNDYRKERFKHLLETGKIVCLPSYQLKREINPVDTFALLGKSLYTSEQTMNSFERSVIQKVAALPNIKWWHRNIDRLEFCINGFLNHYPDFIVYTNSGYIVMIARKQ